MRQRVALVAGVIAAGMLYVSGVDEARAADGATGTTLLLAASWTDAVVTFALLSVPVAAIGAVVGVLGNPLAGVFAAAAGLLFAAIGGGSIDATLRAAPGSGVYWRLAGEAAAWALLMGATATAIVAMSGRLGKAMPWLTPKEATDEEKALATIAAHENLSTSRRAAMRVGGVGVGIAWAVAQAISEKINLRPGVVQTLLSGVVTAVIGMALGGLAARSADVWQLAWGLGIGFMLGALLAHQMFPTKNPVAIVVAPLIAAAACYVYAAVTGGDGTALRAAYYAGELIGPARALPVMYASAGIAGAIAGMGWSQVLIYTREFGDEDEELPEPHVKPE